MHNTGTMWRSRFPTPITPSTQPTNFTRANQVRTSLFCRHLVSPEFSDQAPVVAALAVKNDVVILDPFLAAAQLKISPLCAPFPWHRLPPKFGCQAGDSSAGQTKRPYLDETVDGGCGRAILGHHISATSRGCGSIRRERQRRELRGRSSRSAFPACPDRAELWSVRGGGGV